MRKEEFLHTFKQSFYAIKINGFEIQYKPTCITDLETGEQQRYSSLDEAYEKAVLGGRPLKEIVKEAKETDLFRFFCDDRDLRIVSEEEEKEIFD